MSQESGTDSVFAVGGWLTYNMGFMIPRLDVWYAQGAMYATNATSGNFDDWNYNRLFADAAVVHHEGFIYYKDFSYLSIRPRLDFQVATNALWYVGGLLDIDLSKDGDNDVHYGFFTGVRVSF